MGDATVLLETARQGEPLAAGRIFELLSPELKRIAHARPLKASRVEAVSRGAFVTLDTQALAMAQGGGEDEILRLHEALQDKAQIDPRLVRVVQMRCFVGLGNQEIADSLGVITRAVECDLETARTLLHHILNQA